MGERIMRVGDELGEGRIPHPQCLADEYALSIVIMNSEPPSMGAALDMYPGLSGETSNEDYEDEELIEDWRDQLLAALASHRSPATSVSRQRGTEIGVF